MAGPSIQTSELVKRYGEITALDRVSFSVEKGEIFGFIGPDGSGKTSLFRILTTLLLPDSGSATVEGLDVVKDFRQIRKNVGYMPGRFSLYQDLSVEENLRFYATIYGTTISENYHLIKDIYSQIEPFRKRRAGKLSGGMKQKLALSCALIHNPGILFLDEPTTGVDAVSRREFWEMLKLRKKEGITILVSTPYMDEAGLCDRVALIQHGSIMKIDTPELVVMDYPHQMYSVTSTDTYRLLNDLKMYPGKHSAFAFGQAVHLAITNEQADLTEVNGYLASKGHENIRITLIKPNIEDCFMDLMQKPGETAA